MVKMIKSEFEHFKKRLIIFVAFLLVMVLIQLINSLAQYTLNNFGLLPRTFIGLRGIIFAPFLHGSWSHLFSNLIVLLVLGILAMLNNAKDFLKVSIFVIIGGGALVWIFGRSYLHVGASGWIFGLWSWLLARAIFQRNFLNIIISITVFFFYGGLWFGFLPKEGVSFESHIAGTICGIWMAYITRKTQNKK